MVLCRTPHGVRGLKPVMAADAARKKSRTPHGVRGLKPRKRMRARAHRGRTPHGVRGLKQKLGLSQISAFASHPARGAWIETCGRCRWRRRLLSHPARGAWIETCGITASLNGIRGRTPHGVRGLKQANTQNILTL